MNFWCLSRFELLVKVYIAYIWMVSLLYESFDVSSKWGATGEGFSTLNTFIEIIWSMESWIFITIFMRTFGGLFQIDCLPGFCGSMKFLMLSKVWTSSQLPSTFTAFIGFPVWMIWCHWAMNCGWRPFHTDSISYRNSLRYDFGELSIWTQAQGTPTLICWMLLTYWV